MAVGEGVTVTELGGVATLLGDISFGGGGVASLLKGEAEELGGTAEVAGATVVMIGVISEDVSAAEGTKGLASTLRPDGLLNKVEAGGVLLGGLTAEVISEAGPESGQLLVKGAVTREGVLVTGVVVCESGAEPGGVCRTESKKEKVWDTGLRLSPVINAKLLLTSPAKLLVAALVPEVMLGSGLLVRTLSSAAFWPSLADMGKSSTHMGS